MCFLLHQPVDFSDIPFLVDCDGASQEVSPVGILSP